MPEISVLVQTTARLHWKRSVRRTVPPRDFLLEKILRGKLTNPPVGGLGQGTRLVGWIGSVVLVSVSFQIFALRMYIYCTSGEGYLGDFFSRDGGSSPS